MAPDETIRRPPSSEGGKQGPGKACSNKSNNDNDSSDPSSAVSEIEPSSSISVLTGPASVASGFAKFTHKGEDTWSSCPGLKVEVPGTCSCGREEDGFVFFCC